MTKFEITIEETKEKTTASQSTLNSSSEEETEELQTKPAEIEESQESQCLENLHENVVFLK
jgi:hypothetical protein